MSSLNFIPSDPNTTSRKDFTNNIVRAAIPSNATQLWKDYAQISQSLLMKLAVHPAMRPNLQQTYMTPAASKNKVYFMWDFVGRTLGMLYMIPPNASSDRLDDITSRSMMAASLVLDERPGMLDQMIGSTYAQTENFEFDEGMIADARRLKAV